MAFPTTITTGGDVDEGGGIPYLSSGGNVYVIVRDDVTTTKFRAFKATDPTSSFSNVGTDPTITTGTIITALATVQSGDNIHVVTYAENNVDGNIRYHIFSMSSDSWTTTNEDVVSPTNVTAEDLKYLSIGIRSDGDIIILYNGTRVANMGADRDRVYYARREGTWTVNVAVDNGGATDWHAGGVVIGSSDRMHFFFQDFGANAAYQRCLTSTNSLQTFPASFDTSIYAIRRAMLRLGTSYDSSGTQKVRFPYADAVNVYNSAKCDSADTPTMSTDTDITGTLAADTSDAFRCSSFSADGTTLWHAVVDSVNDLYTQSNVNDGGWSTPALFYTGTVTRLFSNIYTRNGDIVLAMVFSETDPKYHEKVLTAGDTSLFNCSFDYEFSPYGKGWR